jgi:hypothetical protein
VKLAVSTADLLRETNLPPLSSWRIGRAQPTRAKAWRPLPNDLPGLFRGFDHGPRIAPPTTTPPSGGPSTTEAAPPVGGVAGFEKMSTDELRSFEQAASSGSKRGHAALAKPAPAREASFEEDTGADMMQAELSDDEGGADGYASDMDMKTPMRTVAFDDAPTASAAMVPMAPGAPPPPPQARARSGLSFGGMVGGGGRAEMAKKDAGVIRVKDELPTRWRTAYMRMAGAQEQQRGHLVPLEPIARLAWLLDAHDVDGAGRAELQRAVRALVEAQRRLEHTPLPKGTAALLGTHFFAVFEAREKTDVPGDGTYYRVEVRRDDGPAQLEHRCVPRESNDVWRYCKLDVKGAPLPAGPLAVYEDGAFKVNARLDGTGGGKALEINLGVDPDVRIVGRTVHTNQLEKGLMSSTTRVEHKVKVDVRSTRHQPAQVVLYDRLPVPAENVKDVTVSMVEERPPAKRTNKDAFGNEVLGGLEWRVTVMPGEVQSVAHTYAVDLPAKTELDGGNRRE